MGARLRDFGIFAATPEEIALAIITLLSIIIFFFLAKKIYDIKKLRYNNWLLLIKGLPRNAISEKELKIVKKFYYRLPLYQCSRILHDNNLFESLLSDYLESHGSIAAREKVHIMDTVFTQRGDNKFPAINNIFDIQAGEPCGLEINEQNHLGKIVLIKKNAILIHISSKVPEKIPGGARATLSLYRFEQGFTLFHGTLQETGDGYYHFYFSGDQETRKDYHLMTQRKISFSLISWPLDSDQDVYEKIASHSCEDEEIRNDPHILCGTTRVISDRALAFQFLHEEDKDKFRMADARAWQIKMELDEGRSFACIGRIRPAETGEARPEFEPLFFFRYIDVSEKDRENLFQFINENNPVKEKLY